MPGASAKKARAARALLSVLLLLALSVFALLAAVAWGSTGFKVREVLEYLVSGTSNAEVILFKIRLPRALLSSDSEAGTASFLLLVRRSWRRFSPLFFPRPDGS